MTCPACKGQGGHLTTPDLLPSRIPLRSEWVGCEVCHQTGSLVDPQADTERAPLTVALLAVALAAGAEFTGRGET